jgi:prenyl protein peptidase
MVSMAVTSILTALYLPCHDTGNSVSHAVTYCFGVSGAFVGSLYLMVPPKIRQLERNDARQIRWRTLATAVVCIGAVVTYHFTLCDGKSPVEKPIASTGVNLSAVQGVLLHTVILFLGPILQKLLGANEILRRRGTSFGTTEYLRTLYSLYIETTVSHFFYPADESDRWVSLRNLVVAPLAEEIVFRACCVAALASTTMKTSTVVTVAPLFFGVAHGHHALLKLRQGERLVPVLVQTTVQFAYTSLFGMYSSYAYLCTRSVLAVTLCHSFCNWMGLPDLEFLSTSSFLYKYRNVLVLGHVVGLASFATGCASPLLLPPITR